MQTYSMMQEKGTILILSQLGRYRSNPTVGHLILNGLVWKPNGQKESKRPWDVKPNGHIMYYKCISLVNKNCSLLIIFHIVLAAHVCLTWYWSGRTRALHYFFEPFVL